MPRFQSLECKKYSLWFPSPSTVRHGLLFRVINGWRPGCHLATAANFIVASAAFDTSVSPKERIELRQGARVIHASKQE
jgi:hypothetical protein